MAVSSPLSLLIFSLLILSSSAKPPFLIPHFVSDDGPTPTKTTDPARNVTKTPPTRYFEVTKPIKTKTKPCSHLALTHSFAYTYTKPPVTARFRPPTHCGPAKEFSKIVLEWTAASKGRQFDRIFGVWLGGVELLRSCTAEPRANGTVWTVLKDVTRYHSLLVDDKNKIRTHLKTLSVYLGNVVDKTYTGIYHVNVTFHYYPSSHGGKEPQRRGNNVKWADLVLPISRNLPLNDGLWFEIQNSTDTSAAKEFKIPRNAYKAVLEVYVSFHEKDEFWYGNPPNEYLEENGLDWSGNGPFREVVVSLDGNTIGVIWPFTVVFTGGINPLLWRPITAIGSFDLPTYDIDITPSLGRLLDGGSHTVSFSVMRALNVWYVDANLHLWLDKGSPKTEGRVFSHFVPPKIISSVSNFSGFDGTFATRLSRSLESTGWVKSSLGNITTRFSQDLLFWNWMGMGNSGNKQVVDQKIYFNHSSSENGIVSTASSKKFSFYMYSDSVEGTNETVLVSNVTIGFGEKKRIGSSFSSQLDNVQHGQGSMVVVDNLVQRGLGSLEQVYNYVGSDSCYFRNISASNYTILYDHVTAECGSREARESPSRVRRFWPIHGSEGELTL